MIISKLAQGWKVAEGRRLPPDRVSEILELPYEELKRVAIRAQKGNPDAILPIVNTLYSGAVWIVKGMFPASFMRELKAKTVDWTRSRPESFHKMLEGSPDFHRMIDLDAGMKYSFKQCKHSAYFYRWNDDPLQIWEAVTERWRLVKILMGLSADEFEKNTPKDGVVDRIQIVRYPPAIGYLEPHADPHLHQRLFFSGYMSKRGIDFEGGGFYLVGYGNKVIDLEDRLEVGDACIGYATVMHGVAPCDRSKTPDWKATDGRWFLSMYSNASDEVPNRHTGHPVKLDLPNVLPAGVSNAPG